MITLSVLLIALLLLSATIVVKCVFAPKWEWLNRIMIAMLALAIVTGVAATIADGVCGTRIADLEAEAARLAPYHNVVTNTDDEYARFDYYQRVTAYNAEYEDCLADLTNPWIGAFYPKGWDSEISLIDFELRTGYDYADNEVPDGDAAG